MTIGSLFAGIGGFDLGLERAGHRVVWQVEINPQCRRVLRARFPDAALFWDIHEVGARHLERVDVICGGFPCQGLSVAGARKGLADERSGLFYQMTRIVDELKPTWLLWENVPGLLSSQRGRDFAAVLVEMDRIGFDGAWTVADAQRFGLAQRRRRVFGLFARRDSGATAGRAAEVLAFASRMQGTAKASGAARKAVAGTLGGHTANRSRGGDANDNLIVAAPITVNDPRCSNHASHVVVANTLRASDGHHGHSSPRGDGYDNLVVADPITVNDPRCSNHASHVVVAVFDPRQNRVRRLTVRECERLQGFPDDWTQPEDGHKPISDSARYAMLGNAVAVPCAEWIGRRMNG